MVKSDSELTERWKGWGGGVQIYGLQLSPIVFKQQPDSDNFIKFLHLY